MKIEDTLLKKTLNTRTDDPYGESLKFMHRISHKGHVVERTNEYSTNGLFHRSEVFFDLVQPLDKYSRVMLSFFLVGENGKKNSLHTDITASFISEIKETGFFSEGFTEFYMENIFPIMRKTAEEKIESLVSFSEKAMSKAS